MQIEFTVESPTGEQDVRVTAPGQTRLGEVLAEVAAAIDLPAGVARWADGDALRQDQDFGTSGLRIGTVLRSARAVPRPGHDGAPALRVTGGPHAGMVYPLQSGRITVGRDETCEVRLGDPMLSRHHAVIDVRPGRVTVRDGGSANGTWLDGRRIGEETRLRPQAVVRMGETSIAIGAPPTEPALVTPGHDGTVGVLRSPTPPRAWPTTEIAMPEPARADRAPGAQWIPALLPAALAGLLAWLWDAPQLLLFALLSPAMMITTALGDRWHWRRSRRRADADLRRRRAVATREIRLALTEEAQLRRQAAPDPAWLLQIASLPGSRLWERRRDDADFLRLRLGTGHLPSCVQVRRGSELTPAGPLSDVPVDIDLRSRSVGIGLPREQRLALARWLIGQLATLRAPSDLDLVVLLSERAADWRWLRWLPHLRGRIGLQPDEWVTLVDDLNARARARREAYRADPWSGPWCVLVVDRASVVAEATDLATLLANGRDAGIAVICLDDEVTRLPTAAGLVVRGSGAPGTQLLVPDECDGRATRVIPDQVSSDWAATLCRALAPLVDASSTTEVGLPDQCGLLTLLGRPDLSSDGLGPLWRRSTGTARTVLGMSPGSPMAIDLVDNGPHMLIAGTTGSGKSELLRTLVVGLAAHQPPDELTFLLVDYKGGAAFAECDRLPHTAGLVTDLDPYLTERVLRSLRAEVRRREQLFAESGCPDLVAYRAIAPGRPVPRLVVVVDEFATLSEELPDFVPGLVTIARRGRSLGLHLVLATQRPSSVVSPEIRANVTLRIALRVTDPADSRDVIDSDAAAFIEHAAAGRGYLRRGTDLTAFQAAHVSSVTSSDPEKIRVELLQPWRRRPSHRTDGPGDLAVLVGLIGRTAAQERHVPVPAPWHPPLPETVPRHSLAEPAEPASVTLGLVDRPDHQERVPWTVDLARGTSLLVAGAGRSGRTTSLASLALGAASRLGPDQLALYIVDARGTLAEALAGLPHCATVLGPQDLALTPRLLQRLGSVADKPTDGVRHMLLLDDWPAVADSLTDTTASDAAHALAGLLRAGPSIGLTVAVTGDRSVLLPRFASSFSTRLLLRLADRLDYGVAGIAARDVPATLSAGRGIRPDGGDLVQVADPGPFDQAVATAEARWAGTLGRPAHAVYLAPLPERISVSDVAALPGRLVVGVGGDVGAPITVAPFDDADRLLVAGPPRSGRTTLLRLLLDQALTERLDVIVAAPERSELRARADAAGIPCLSPSDNAPASPPLGRPTLLVVDDCEAFADTPIGERLTDWLRTGPTQLAAVVAGRAEDLALAYRGLGAEARRGHRGVLLRPGPLDGELLGVRLPREPRARLAGRGMVIGPATWGAPLADGDPVPIQVALP